MKEFIENVIFKFLFAFFVCLLLFMFTAIYPNNDKDSCKLDPSDGPTIVIGDKVYVLREVIVE